MGQEKKGKKKQRKEKRNEKEKKRIRNANYWGPTESVGPHGAGDFRVSTSFQ